MKSLALAAALLLGGCAFPKRGADSVPQQRVVLTPVTDELDVIVACPDDGVHILVNGICVDTAGK